MGWAKGQSGNLKGRPPSHHSGFLAKKAREYTQEALDCLVAACREGNIVAAMALLDRGYGKPAQTILGDREQPLLVDFRWANDPLPEVIEQVLERTIDAAEDDYVWATAEAPD